MASGWRTAKLGELVSFKTGKLDSNAAVPNGDYPFFTCSQETLRTNTYSFDTECVRLAGNNANGIYPLKYFHGKFDAYQRTYVVTTRDPNRLTTRFLYYALRPKLTEFRSISTGAATKFLTLTILNETELQVPPLPVQRRIGAILSAYDELMENSQRRIRILEAMARALYREWFVHFRFPGSEKLPSPRGRRAGGEGVKLEKLPRVASPLGDIPQGWEAKTIADVCESASYGYTASASREEVGPKFLRITDIVPDVIDWAGVPFCEIPADKAPKYLLKHGDIVVARTGATTGYAKRLNKLHPDTVFASYLVRARAKAGVSNRMLGILMESDEYKQFIKTNIGGAAQPQANAVVLTSMRLAVPPSPVGEEFDRLVASMMDEAELLAIKIQNLRRTRDLLLPRLLSRQVELGGLKQ